MKNQRPNIVAHRCGAGLRAENTLAALHHAISIGADAVEVDVHLTADDVVVVHHDFALNPAFAMKDGRHIGDTGRPLRETDYAQLMQYTVGEPDEAVPGVWNNSSFKPVAGEKIHKLAEFLETLYPSNLDIFIEIKSNASMPNLSAPPPELAAAVCEEIADAKVMDRASIISFDWRVLEAVQHAAPSLRRGFLSVGARENYDSPDWFGSYDPRTYGGGFVEAIAAAGGDFWSPSFTDLTPDLREAATKRGLGVSVWTCNHEKDIEAMIAMGVDWLTTDRPDIALQIASKSGLE